MIRSTPEEEFKHSAVATCLDERGNSNIESNSNDQSESLSLRPRTQKPQSTRHILPAHTPVFNNKRETCQKKSNGTLATST